MNFFKYLLGCVTLISSYSFAVCPVDVGAVFTSNLADPPYLICSTGGTFEGQPIGKCEFMADSMNKKPDGFEIFAHTTGKTCENITVLNETKEPDPDPNPVLECTTDSCPNPNNLRCPTGYVSGSFNGQKICAKSKDPEPDTSCDPESKDCSELRTERIVTAVDNANADITDSVNNLGDRLDNPLNYIKDALVDISDKLATIADNIRNGGGSNPNPDPNGGVDTSPFHADVPINETVARDLDSGLFSSSSQCPASNVLSLPNYNIHYEFKYAEICDFLHWFSYLVMIFAYIVAAHIVIKA